MLVRGILQTCDFALKRNMYCRGRRGLAGHHTPPHPTTVLT